MSRPPTTWKGFELRMAKLFGGQRRGADFRGRSGGRNDIIKEGFSLECKFLTQPRWGDIQGAVQQAISARDNEDDVAVAIVKKKGDPDSNALAIMLVGEFVANFVGGIDNDSNP